MKTNYKSPLGNIIFTYSQKGIQAISLDKKVPKVDEETIATKKLRESFDEYFDGNLDIFKTFPQSFLDIKGTDFQKKVWRELKLITCDKTKTYSEIAQNVGSPKAYRAVGSAVGKNPLFIMYPCHRVLGKNKTLNGFAYGLDVKVKLLKRENLEFIA